MIVIQRKKFGLPFTECFFLDDARSSLEQSLIGIIFHVQLKKKPFFGFFKKTKTVLMDLSMNVDDIYKAFKPNLRNEINKSSKFDGFKFDWIDQPNEFELQEFKTNYDIFANKMNISRANNQVLANLKSKGALVLSRTVNQDQVLCRHALVSDGYRLRLLYSCSNHRLVDGSQKNLISRANKSLHWFEIVTAKNNGFFEYDFGGLSNNGKTQNIDRFKKSFGGIEVNEYTGITIGFN